MQRTVGFILLVCAYILLYPGLSQPMLTVTGTVEKTALLELGKEMLAENKTKVGLMGDMAGVLLNNMKVSGTINAFDKTRSILGTVRDLFQSKNTLVAILIMTFSVLIPVFKGFLTLICLLDISAAKKASLGWFSANISKWSMADVFVISIFVTYLAANGIREDTGLVQFSSTLGPGFYYFLGYCIVSILASQLLAPTLQGKAPNKKRAR